ncbi:response regulator [Methanocella sp. MCL-LM]|uniref:response regulator n=1 Tax=Methanocella sp. MCL-LM TaxID=3412035 RepID=UPI003C78CAF7
MVASIAIVEDEPELRSLYCLALKSRGYSVSFTASGVEEAVRAYEASLEKPSLVIMDVRLVDGTGFDAAEKIALANPEARFLFATADADVVSSMVVSGMTGVLQKPFSLKEMLDSIGMALASRHSHVWPYPGHCC